MPDQPVLFADSPAAEADASISACGRYRWSLSREWDWKRPWCGWIMLNPSTADAKENDQTIRKCISFSRGWGFGGLAVRNLYCLRSTDPQAILSDPDPIGSEADAAILDLLGVCPLIIAAWGANPRLLQGRDRHVYKLLKDADPDVELFCLKKTAEGYPWHPLYVRGNTVPVEFEIGGDHA